MTDEEAYIERMQPDYRPPESEPPVRVQPAGSAKPGVWYPVPAPPGLKNLEWVTAFGSTNEPGSEADSEWINAHSTKNGSCVSGWRISPNDPSSATAGPNRDE